MEKTNRLINPNITHVSFVKRGANKKKFLMMKSGASIGLEKDIDIIAKSDEVQKLTYGVVYAPDEVDSQGDFASADVIEKMAHSYMQNGASVDSEHNFIDGFGTVVESYIAPNDIVLGEESVAKGSWVLVVKASDEVWGRIESGEVTGYSMAGTSVRVPEPKAQKFIKNLFQKKPSVDDFLNVPFGSVMYSMGSEADKEEVLKALDNHYNLQKKEILKNYESKDKEESALEYLTKQDMIDTMKSPEMLSVFKSAIEAINAEKELRKSAEEEIRRQQDQAIEKKIAEGIAKALSGASNDSRQLTGNEVLKETSLIKSAGGGISDF